MIKKYAALLSIAAIMFATTAFADVAYVSFWGPQDFLDQGGIDKILPDGTVESFVQSGLNKPEGIAFDSHGNLFVACLGSNEIDKITPTGIVSQFVSFGSGMSNEIYGLATDKSDNLYVTLPAMGIVKKITQDPTPIISTYATNLGQPQGLAFGPNGYLYVTGEPLTLGAVVKIVSANNAQPFVSNVADGYGLAFDGKSTLYLSGANGTAIDSVDANGNIKTVTAMHFEYGLAVDSSGILIGADQGTNSNKISEFSIVGGKSTVLSSIAVDEGPRFVATINPLGDFNRDGHVDVLDVSAMMSALVNPTNYESANHITDDDLLVIGDLNADGNVNNLDIQSLIDKVANQSGSQATAVPEPSTLTLLALGAIGLLAARWH